MDVIQQARTYLGTPFHWHSRIKGLGVDCVGLPICVARDCRLVPLDFDYQDYGNTPQHVPTRFLDFCDRIERPNPGNIAIFNLPHGYHIGILSDCCGLGMIHASIRRGVIEHILDEGWLKRLDSVYKFPGAKQHGRPS